MGMGQPPQLAASSNCHRAGAPLIGPFHALRGPLASVELRGYFWFRVGDRTDQMQFL